MRSRDGQKRKTGTKHKGIDLSLCHSFGERWTQRKLRRLGAPLVRIAPGANPNFTRKGTHVRKLGALQEQAYENIFLKMLYSAGFGNNAFKL